ncbi:MAG: aa3-type cytochrome c oxidase subunit IV [Salaquimonas sp.]
MAKAVKSAVKSAAKKTASKKSTTKASSAPANAMDYSEHAKTYDLFLWLSKWTVVGCVALLLAMMVGFFGGDGLVGGTIVFLVLMVISFFFI